MTEDTVALAEQLASRFAARAESYDTSATYPHADVADLRDAGLLGLMVPTELGGFGAGFAEYVRVAMALAQGNAATALLFNMHASVTGALAGVTPEFAASLGAPPEFAELRDRVLRDAAEGSMYSVAISEAGAGSRLSQLTTTYERTPAGYRITGTKVSCSGAQHAHAFLVAARAADHDEPVVSYFLVARGPGVTVGGDWDPLGMRATESLGVVFDVEVPQSALLGIEGVALLLADTMPEWLVASYAAVYAGLAVQAVREAARYLAERGGDVAAATRARLGRADAATAAACAVVEAAGRAVDAAPGDPTTNEWVYRAKLVAGDTAMDVAASLAEACGLGALRHGSALERLFRDARFGAVMPPRSDICADWLGVRVLGLDHAKAMDVPPW